MSVLVKLRASPTW